MSRILAVALALFVSSLGASELPTDFMGVRLGGPFEMPECTAHRTGGYVFSWDQPITPCWKHETWGTPGTPVAASNTFEVQFVAASDKQPVGITRANLVVVNGTVEAVKAFTNGSKSQIVILSALTGKYGSPSTASSVPVQNGMGASYSSHEATWDADNLRVVFSGLLGRIDSGIVIAGTPAGFAHFKAQQTERDAKAARF